MKKALKTVLIVIALLGSCALSYFAIKNTFFVAEKAEDLIELYNTALKQMDEGNYGEAYENLNKLDVYKDVDELKRECKYNIAIETIENKQYIEASEILEELGDYEGCEELKKECQYGIALEDIEKGNFAEAYLSLAKMKGYKNCAQLAESIYDQYWAQFKDYIIKNAEVEDVIYFGRYEQDNDESNGKEDIEWHVISKENNKLLVLSVYTLDCYQFNVDGRKTKWAESDLRQWLNADFINNAFNTEEQEMIALSLVSADEIFGENNDQGERVEDKIFVLSEYEFNLYCCNLDNHKEISAGKATEFARGKGVERFEDSEHQIESSHFWVRTFGETGNPLYGDGLHFHIIFVSDIYADTQGVRPAMWININE